VFSAGTDTFFAVAMAVQVAAAIVCDSSSVRFAFPEGFVLPRCASGLRRARWVVWHVPRVLLGERRCVGRRTGGS